VPTRRKKKGKKATRGVVIMEMSVRSSGNSMNLKSFHLKLQERGKW
jgi:hypothetical protein